MDSRNPAEQEASTNAQKPATTVLQEYLKEENQRGQQDLSLFPEGYDRSSFNGTPRSTWPQMFFLANSPAYLQQGLEKKDQTPMTGQQDQSSLNRPLESRSLFTSNPYLSPYTYQYSNPQIREDITREEQSLAITDQMRTGNNGWEGEGNGRQDLLPYGHSPYPRYPDAFSQVFTNNLNNVESSREPLYRADEASEAHEYTDHGLATVPSAFSTPRKASSEAATLDHSPASPNRPVPNTYKRVNILESEMVQIRPSYKRQFAIGSTKQRTLRLTVDEHMALLDLRGGMTRVGSTRPRAVKGLPEGYVELEKERRTAKERMRSMTAGSASTGADMYTMGSFADNTPTTPKFDSASTSQMRYGLRSYPATMPAPSPFDHSESASASTQSYIFQNHIASMASHPEFALPVQPHNKIGPDTASGIDSFGDEPAVNEQEL
ncbi:hypothetical protein GLAREA_03682 [Glarea lozoyensis ATCC 20868]|nr:uncharacterized protein GLAREA_03682 [Glarea lozoyensis ATCC 20868]EPE30715.1 hypothetical protein GLAREA_03682 [Glarea lozoyensis ATCC 20868]